MRRRKMPRFNYTGRKKISREDAVITITQGHNGYHSFNANLRLKDYKLPDNALVFIEAYRQTTWMRFDYGRAGNPVEPTDRNLYEFETPDGIRFRVKITSEDGENGKLLAQADKIRPRQPDMQDESRLPLLPVRPKEMYGIWKLDFTGEEPILEINKNAGNKDAITHSSQFRSLVFPSILREILTRIATYERPDDSEDMDDWRARWICFARLLPSVEELPLDGSESGVIDQWVDNVVSSFSRVRKDLEVFLLFWEGEKE